MKRGRRFVSFLLAMVMVCSLMVSAGAAEAQEEISAYLSYDITVTYNGEAQTMTDAAGNTVYPVSYNGTTYLPVRAVSNMLGVAVEWDGTTQTVILSDSTDGRTVAENGGAASTASGQEEIKAYLAPGITVKYKNADRCRWEYGLSRVLQWHHLSACSCGQQHAGCYGGLE